MDQLVGWGLVATAGGLGLTHGIEPDHLAGITALTHDADDPRLSALVGGCFAVGHALLVVLWVTLATVFFHTTTFPPAFEQVGLLCVGVVLALLSVVLGVTGMRRLVHEHSHDHGSGPHSHYHLHLPEPFRRGGHDDHDHSVVGYLKIGVVGALFTLSPPVSMIAFLSVTLSGNDPTLTVTALGVYTAAIVATMTAIGGSTGTLFRLARAGGQRVHAWSTVVASLAVFAFALHLLWQVLPPLLT